MPAEMGREYLSEHVPSPHLREYYLMSSAFPSSSGFPPGGEDGRKASLTLRAIGEQPLAFGGDRGIKESNPDLGARKRAIGGTGAPRVAIGMDQKEASVERRRAPRRAGATPTTTVVADTGHRWCSAAVTRSRYCHGTCRVPTACVPCFKRESGES